MYRLLLCLLLAAPLWAADVPDPRLTPGVVRPGLTKAKICAIKWGKDERHVTAVIEEAGLHLLWLQRQRRSEVRAGR